jgi:hypothetical protein
MSCHKINHDTPFTASQHALSLKRKLGRKARIGVYYCKECKGYHATTHFKGNF